MLLVSAAASPANVVPCALPHPPPLDPLGPHGRGATWPHGRESIPAMSKEQFLATHAQLVQVGAAAAGWPLLLPPPLLLLLSLLLLLLLDPRCRCAAAATASLLLLLLAARCWCWCTTATAVGVPLLLPTLSLTAAAAAVAAAAPACLPACPAFTRHHLLPSPCAFPLSPGAGGGGARDRPCFPGPSAGGAQVGCDGATPRDRPFKQEFPRQVD